MSSMSIREQAAALAEMFGPTGVQIAHGIRALPEEAAPHSFRTLLIDARNLIATNRHLVAGLRIRNTDAMLTRLDTAIFGHDGKAVPPSTAASPWSPGHMLTPESVNAFLADAVPLPVTPSLDDVLVSVRAEVEKSDAKWPAYTSAHEGYGVLLEEVDEVWDHVKVNQKRRDLPALRKELIQVAAVAIRFARGVIDSGRGRA
jgi:NTP pyrophosphatase (non-canonical NTP hydrolase)